jgi:hypothetical protein
MSKFSPEEREAILRQAREHVANREPLSDEARLRKVERSLEEQQREREPIIRKVHDGACEPQPHEEADASTWDNWLDERLGVRIRDMMQAAGEEISALLDEERKTSRDELAAEVRRLWAVISELQQTIKAFNRIERAKASLESMPVERERVN